MLSKVAARVYWMGRYLERVENTARLIGVYDSLLFDLPSSVNLGWYNLILINGAEEDFLERYTVQNERNVIKFLIGDETNSSSMVSCLQVIRENVRTTRDVLPVDIWELINELSMYVSDNLQQGINRSKRHAFLDDVVKACQQILGLLYSTMPHDRVWNFLRLGRNIERADMTTRVLDAGAFAVLHLVEDDSVVNIRQIIWGNVLRSLGAEQSYRRITRSSIKGANVANYLLENEVFPRTIAHCLNALVEASSDLPGSKSLLAQLKKLQKNIFSKVDYEHLDNSFCDYLNEQQLELASIHKKISDTWFSVV